MPAPANICFGKRVDCVRCCYSADEVLGANVKILMPSPYRDDHDPYLENFRHTGTKRIIGIGREVTGRRVRSFAVECLTNLGYRVVAAMDGRQRWKD